MRFTSMRNKSISRHLNKHDPITTSQQIVNRKLTLLPQLEDLLEWLQQQERRLPIKRKATERTSFEKQYYHSVLINVVILYKPYCTHVANLQSLTCIKTCQRNTCQNEFSFKKKEVTIHATIEHNKKHP